MGTVLGAAGAVLAYAAQRGHEVIRCLVGHTGPPLNSYGVLARCRYTKHSPLAVLLYPFLRLSTGPGRPWRGSFCILFPVSALVDWATFPAFIGSYRILGALLLSRLCLTVVRLPKGKEGRLGEGHGPGKGAGGKGRCLRSAVGGGAHPPIPMW